MTSSTYSDEVYIVTKFENLKVRIK